MSKLQDLKVTVLSKLGPLGNIFLKKSEAASPSYTKPGPFKKFQTAFKEGSSFTRFLVTISFLAFIVGFYSLTKLSAVLVQKKDRFAALLHREDPQFDKMQEFLKHEAELNQDIGTTVSIDRIRINALRKDGKLGFMSISLWVKCSNLAAAKTAETEYPKLHDAIVRQIQTIKETEITTEEGKLRIQAQMRDAMNTVIKDGKVTAVYFYNVLLE